METIYAAAQAASRAVLADDWKVYRINEAQARIASNQVSRRLTKFYFDEIDRMIDLMIVELNCDPA